ncbi:MAG: DUF423 domain-containing protein [Bacteroidetes bacterium]|jgi:uncharacterized membrane protein YgdD (TMEM256/DUF423 family)|nr:DUF423 domain-containing protein [Bacteroidota bacterium]MBP7256402.1 DUF423 domain-containing protein [Chitinophagales bacterium]MBK7139756.1 DUF423 domain-containing protein [Bacteroidota bacterium]MBK8673022.1 DUF423 domain-containing protein [Bacteroidota bacterium]MBL0080220.1 DUF423 domain-containing protein [Bacteroidota bacterium]
MKFFLTTGFLLAAVAVALGAFGAHGLKPKLSIEQLQTYETAVKYQFYHVFALIVVGILMQIFPNLKLAIAGDFFLTGIILFCGSLYLLACKDLLGLQSISKFIGPITPLGGLCFIIGWVILFVKVLRM